MLHSNISINEKGHLAIAGRDTVELAEKYGTPLYIMDETRLRENCRVYVNAMKENFGGASMPAYASKALSFKRIYSIAAQEGMGADVVSSGELYTALKAGFPAKKLIFHGSNKTDADIRYGIDNGVGLFAVDNYEELNVLDEYAGECEITQDIILRLSPGIDPHTFEAINTGKVDSKFGAAIETGQARELAAYAMTKKNIRLRGYHCHIGSQIFDIEPFTDAADIMLSFAAEIRRDLGHTADIVNLGGGFGVRYLETDPQINIAENIAEIARHIKEVCAREDMPMPAIYMEPGRSIAADTMLTVYTAGAVKTIPGFKSYASIDGGMGDNPRYALYGAPYTVITANKANLPADFKCTIAGRCCESGDLIQENVQIAKPERGDKLAVLVTGAYNYSMASNYNRVPRPPIVMIDQSGEDYVAVRRETFADITACDM